MLAACLLTILVILKIHLSKLGLVIGKKQVLQITILIPIILGYYVTSITFFLFFN